MRSYVAQCKIISELIIRLISYKILLAIHAVGGKVISSKADRKI